MARFDEETPIADGLRELAILLVVLWAGTAFADWIGEQTDSRLLTGLMGFATAAVLLFIVARFFSNGWETPFGPIGEASSTSRMMNALKWIVAVGVVSLFGFEISQSVSNGLDLTEARTLGFFAGIMTGAAFQSIIGKGMRREQVNP